MMKTASEHTDAGRQLIVDGGLLRLREQLGLTRLAMADLLQMSPVTYNRCEDNAPEMKRMWNSTAERLGRFAYLAARTMQVLTEDGIGFTNLIPLHLAAMGLGLPQDQILTWIRAETIDFEDLGVLGIWLYREDLPKFQDLL